MTKEELIKALEKAMGCYHCDCPTEECEDCPYYNYDTTADLIENALKYLKEN